MQLIDSHCHLDLIDLAEHGGSVEGVVEAAERAGITHFLSVGTRLSAFPDLLQIASKFVNVNVSVGLHPTEDEGAVVPYEQLLEYGRDPLVLAIGETGLDYYRNEGDLEWQRERFRQHIRAAKVLHKPIIIHTRQAAEDTLRILREENASETGGVFHCFTEDWNVAEAALDLGFYISLSGIVTFKNATTIQEVARKVPLDRLLVETDSPYLAPVPMRGKPNQPAFVRYVAEFIAGLRGITLEEVAQQTTQNFFRLFKR